MPSLVAVEVAGESFPYRSQPRCKTCAHPARSELERLLARGRTYRGIITELGLGEELTERNIREHVSNGHLPLHAPAVREVARQEGESVRETVEPLVEGVAQHLTFAHAVVERVRRRVEAGEEEPTVRDAIAAARLITEVEAASGSPDTSEWQGVYVEMLQAVTDLMTEDQLAEFGRRMRRWQRTRDPRRAVPQAT